MMTLWVLVLSHSVCVLLGALGGRWLVIRTMRPLIVRETVPLSHRDLRPPRSFWLGVALLVSSLLVIGIGVQAHLASVDKAERDRKEHAYSVCMTRFASELVHILDKRGHAVAKLDRARTVREDAVDNIIITIIKVRANPPRATDKDFAISLHDFLKAKKRLIHVQKSVATTRRQNTFKPPEATCQR